MNKFISMLILVCLPLFVLAQETPMADPIETETTEQMATAAAESDEPHVEVVIELSAEEDAQQRDEVDRAMDEVDALLAELDDELGNWSDEDRRALIDAVRGLEEINLSSNIGVGESLVAILAISLTLGMPVIIVGIVAYSSYRKKRLMHDTLNQYVNSDRDIPPEVVKLLTASSAPKNNLQSGLVLVGIGAGLVVFFLLVGAGQAAGIGAIPLFIGLAKLLIWKLEKKSSTNAEV